MKSRPMVDFDLEEVKRAIASMYGKYRFPTLLKEVDSLARGYVSSNKDN